MERNRRLINKIDIEIRFSEVDMMGIAWHGNYIKYFEDGREAFGKEFGISYMQIYDKGYMVPLINVNCDYKKYIKYGQKIIVETEFINNAAAKIVYQFRIFNKINNELMATGETTQVFVTPDGELMLTYPEFFLDWKQKMGLSVE